MKSIFRRTMLFIVAGALLLSGSVLAQGGVLNYGDAVTGSLTAEAPIAFYTFNGNPNELVTIQVLSLTPGFTPSVGLNAPSQQQLAFSTPDAFNPGLVRVSQVLPDSGLYTIIVSGNNAVGEFALRLDGSALNVMPELPQDSPVELLPENPLVYPVAALPDSDQTLSISSDTPDYSFAVVLRSAEGQQLAQFNGSDTLPVTIFIPAGDSEYTVEVRPQNPLVAGSVSFSLSGTAAEEAAPTVTATATPADEDVPPPVTTEEAEAPPPDDDVCRAVNNGGNNINVRSGPGTDYNVVDTLASGASYELTGYSGDWYVGTLPSGVQGWVFGGVVSITGDCSGLPVVGVDAPAPSATYTPLPTVVGATPTYTPTTLGATATYTPSYTPTVQAQSTATPTATYTPSYTPTTQPAAQIAPPDSNYALQIPLDNTVSVLDFVSYPDGDTQDRISYSVTGMNPNVAFSGGRAQLTISVTCFGENTDQIEFFTNRQTFACGDTVVDREVTFDSNTGSITVTAIGGEGTYVQWVLTGTATRSN